MSEEIEKFQEQEIICPYCGWENTDSWESGLEYDGDTGEEECPDCDKKFSIQMNISTTYTTNGLCAENNVKHNWEEFDHETDGKRCKGRNCLTCGEHEFDKTPSPKAENTSEVKK